MTGGAAHIDPTIGGYHSEWDSYITGRTLELEPNRRIVQSWRTAEFPADSPDSHLEVLLEAVEGGTKLTLKHSRIPEGQGKSYESGWVENYFDPMKRYFAA
jgi:activator of HSP90 ATPase